MRPTKEFLIFAVGFVVVWLIISPWLSKKQQLNKKTALRIKLFIALFWLAGLSTAAYMVSQFPEPTKKEAKKTIPTSSSVPANPGAPVEPAGPSQITLFFDDFSKGFSTDKWAYQNNYESVPTPPSVNASFGNPAPSLSLPFPKNASSYTVTSILNPFNTQNGFSISADIRQPNAVSSAPDNNSWVRSFRLQIYNQNDGRMTAYVEISPSTQTIDYVVSRDGPYKLPHSATPYNSDYGFHNFKFTVDSDGNTKWYRDGALKLSETGFPAGNYQIKLISSGNAQNAKEAYFHSVDNVLVTVP